MQDVKGAHQHLDRLIDQEVGLTVFDQDIVLAVGIIRIQTERVVIGNILNVRVKTAKLPTGRLGLWVKPGWYKRPFVYDATIRCG